MSSSMTKFDFRLQVPVDKTDLSQVLHRALYKNV